MKTEEKKIVVSDESYVERWAREKAEREAAEKAQKAQKGKVNKDVEREKTGEEETGE